MNLMNFANRQNQAQDTGNVELSPSGEKQPVQLGLNILIA